MSALNDLHSPYFYPYIPVIHDLVVLITFSPFEAEVLVVANVAPLRLFPMSRSWLWNLKSRVGDWKSIPQKWCSSLFAVPRLVLQRWMGDPECLGLKLFKPYSNHYKNLKEKFMRVRGKDGASMVTIGEDGTPRFPLSWIENLVAITSFNFDY